MVTPLALVLSVNLVLALLVAALADPIATRLLDEPRFAGPLRALALVLPLTVLAQMLAAALSGLEQVRGEFMRKIVEQTGRIVLAPAGLALGLGVAGAVLGMAAAAAAAAAVVGYLLLRSLPRGGRTAPIGLRLVIGFAWPQTVANSAAQLVPVAMVVLLSNAADVRTVALFGAALAIARLPSLVYNAFSYRFSPAISRLYASGDMDELAAMLRSVTRWVAMASLPLYALPIALPGALLAIFGPQYTPAAATLAVLAAASLLNALAGPVEWALIMTGRVRLEMAANLAAVAVALLAAAVLVPRLGLIGAALSTVVWTVVMNGLKILFVSRTLGMRSFDVGMLSPLAAAAAASAAAAAAASLTGLDDSIAGVVLLGTALVAAYAALMLKVLGVAASDREALREAFRPSR